LTHTAILETRQLHWADEAACAHFATDLASRLVAQPAITSAVVELAGPLGAGKTTLIRHLLRALGVTGRIKSPTYAVLEPYEVELPSGRTMAVSHFDFYRFDDPREWSDAGFRDVFSEPGLKLCEWADKVASSLPTPDLRLSLAINADDSRTLSVQTFTDTGRSLLP
jgi:tRNA threonylcarbamoyladenosine biosynthesis protein TsaE